MDRAWAPLFMRWDEHSRVTSFLLCVRERVCYRRHMVYYGHRRHP